MTLGLSRSARLQQFLTARHGRLVRGMTGAAAYLATLAATVDRMLAHDVYTRVAAKGDFRLGLRLTSWYLCQRWPRLRLTKHAFFPFHDGMDEPRLMAQRRFLTTRARPGNRGMWLCDCAAVSAALALLQPGTELARFLDDADAVLDEISAPTANADPPPKAYHPPFRLADAAEAIRDLAAAFPPDRWPWFVISGTFLGLVREGDFLKHDTDIDLGIIASDVDLAAFCEGLRSAARFSVHGEEAQTVWHDRGEGPPGSLTRPVLIKLAHQNGTAIDMFIHYREGGVIWHGSAHYRWDNADFALEPYPFCGTVVLGPADADRYLTENYGTWRIPVTEFHYTSDTTNLTVVDSPLAVMAFLRRALASGGQNPRARDGLLRVLDRAGQITHVDGAWRMVRDRLR